MTLMTGWKILVLFQRHWPDHRPLQPVQTHTLVLIFWTELWTKCSSEHQHLKAAVMLLHPSLFMQVPVTTAHRMNMSTLERVIGKCAFT